MQVFCRSRRVFVPDVVPFPTNRVPGCGLESGAQGNLREKEPETDSPKGANATSPFLERCLEQH